MASTNKTSLGLNKWLGSDKIQRVDFNNDNDKIDAVIGSVIPLANSQAQADPTFDNSTIINNMLSSMTTGTLLFSKKNGSNKYGISDTIIVPTGVNIDFNGCELVATSNFPSNKSMITYSNVSKSIIANGILNAKTYAKTGIDILNSTGIKMYQLRITDAVDKGCYIHGNSSANISFTTIEISTNVTATIGSVGLELASADNKVVNVVCVGYSTGFKSTENNNHFAMCHAWNTSTSDLAHVPLLHGFYCAGQGNTYTSCIADSPRTADGNAATISNPGYGFYIDNYNQSFVNCSMFIPYFANIVIPTNTSVGFYDNKGYNSFFGCFVQGRSSLVKPLKDYDGSGLTNDVILGNTTTNVTTTYSPKIGSVSNFAVINPISNSYARARVVNDIADGWAELMVSANYSGKDAYLRIYGASAASTWANRAVLGSNDLSVFSYNPFYLDIGSAGSNDLEITSTYVGAKNELRSKSSTGGLVLKSPDGSYWRQTINNSGVTSWVKI